LCAIFLPACTSESEREAATTTVILYVSADDYVVRQVVARFEEKTGIDVQTVGDTEATKTTGLVNRIRGEADNSQADVFWSSEVFMMIKLAEEGFLEPHISDTTESWPAQYTGEDHRWHGFALRARAIVYAPDRVSEDQLPKTWLDLGKSRFKDRIVMADPRFGTTRGHMGAMKAHWTNVHGPDAFVAYLQNLKDNNVRFLTSGNAGVVEAVANGEADFGMTDTDDVWAAQRNGLKVDLIYPSHGIDANEPNAGTLLIPNSVARIKGGANPEAAAVLIDFLLSAEVERMLAESDSHNIPIREETAREFEKYAVRNPLVIDYKVVAAEMDAAVKLAMETLDE